MIVRDLMTPAVATAAPDTTLEEIATLMRDEDTGAIPVLDGHRLIGMVTDRDIVIRCVAQGRDASETVAAEVMSSDVESISPDSDVQEASWLMSEKQIRRLTVVQDGHLAGMLSLGDIAVKERERAEDVAGEALEQISQGVKTLSFDGYQATGAKGSRQGIASHSASGEEVRRDRVVPFRRQGKRTPRGNTG